jgi:hypothetical protein
MKIDWKTAPEWANALIKNSSKGHYWVTGWNCVSRRQEMGCIFPDSVNADTSDTNAGHKWELLGTRSEATGHSDAEIIDSYMIEVATLTGVLYAWMESEGYQLIYQEIANTVAGHDAQRGACLRLSIEVMRILDRIIDWDLGEHAVFSYDHLEDVGRGIPMLLTDILTVDQWGQLAANYAIPNTLKALLTDYVRDCHDIHLALDPVRDAMIDRFCKEVDVPRAIGQRAYLEGWRKTA